MKIFLHPTIRPLILFACLLLPSPSFAGQGLTTKSMLVSLAIPAIGGIYTASINDIEGLREWGMSALVTAQLTTLLKYSVQRERPNGENDQSFPSGHTSAAFMGASYLHHRYGLAWGLPMYGIAAVIGWQRVNVDDHFWTDVIAGAAIGYGVAALFTVKYPGVRIGPIFDPHSKAYGIQINADL